MAVSDGTLQTVTLPAEAGRGARAVDPTAHLAEVYRDYPGLPALAGLPPGAVTAMKIGPVTGALAPVLLIALGLWAFVIARLAVGRSEAPAPRTVWSGGVPDHGSLRVHPLGFYSPVREALRRAYPAPHWHRLKRPGWVIPALDPDRWLYRPAAGAGRRMTEGLRHVHTGVPHVYLAWQLVGAVALALLLTLLLRR